MDNEARKCAMEYIKEVDAELLQKIEFIVVDKLSDMKQKQEKFEKQICLLKQRFVETID